ncbi:MAG: hypothetical protein Q4E47_00060 [Candidatus Saccharibacteria bacterium]|nr:hypothetical protein [Candidatus Saccharibacteria bacterium]
MDTNGGLIAIGIILLAALVHASLQIALGSLLVLFHANLADKSDNKARISTRCRTLASHYTCGAYIIISLFVSSIAFFISTLLNGGLSKNALLIIAALLLALGVIAWLFYYKTGRTTELWIPRKLARYINTRAKRVTSSFEAFSLGLLAVFAEMPFAFLLMTVAADSLLILPFYIQPAVVFIYTFIAVAPLEFMRFAIKNGQTIVDIQKWRVRNKLFLKFITGQLFITLAIVVLIWRVIAQ